MPYAFGLAQFGKGRHFDIAPLPLAGESIAKALARLEREPGVLPALRRAEILFRNAFVFPPALAAYEAAIRKAPEDPLVLETLADRALYLGFPELAIPALAKIERGVELRLAEAYANDGDPGSARLWTERALAENPFDWYALHRLKHLAERHGSAQEVALVDAQIAALTADPAGRVHPVELTFDPAQPAFHPESTVQSDGVTVYDHSHFRVTMKNTSYRPVEIESVRLTSHGTAAASGLGEVRDYWRYPAGGRRLRPGESVSFEKLWGFTVDTGHEHVRYTFRTCWRGVGEDVRQCRTHWVDVLP
jgi:tetratricopeptide (TPR) repeat protein